MTKEYESDYPKLYRPNFEPQIPEHLLNDLSPEMRHLMNEVNISRQYHEWTAEAMVNTNEQVRKTNGRLKRVEGWKDKMTHFGTLILASIVVVSSIFGLVHKILEITGQI